MASDRAKELAREQKAQRKAEKLRKKNSQDPRDWGTARQMREVYSASKKEIPALPWILLGCALGPIVVGIILGIVVTPKWFWILIGILAGFTITMLVFTRLARKALYKKFHNQTGSAEIAFNDLNKKKYTTAMAISLTKSGEVVHRVIGRQGVILVGEGEPGRLRKMLETERKRHEQIAYDIPVTTIQMGDKDGQVRLEKLAAHIKKLPKVIDQVQVGDVESRLRALDNVRDRFNMPKGPLPTKVPRKAMRGR